MKVLKNFIVIEGIDGAGKSTQAREIVKRFINNNTKAVFEKTPTDGEIGKLIRRFLTDKNYPNAQTMSHLFIADMIEFVKKLPDLTNNNYVVCDRYLFSTIAYQSIGFAFRRIVDMFAGFPLPEFLFYLDINPQISLERIKNRDKDIYENIDFLEKVKNNYKRTLNYFEHIKSSNMKIIELDGNHLPVYINDQIWSILNNTI